MPLALAALVAGFAVIYSLEGLTRHWNFASSFDLAIYDQAVWHFSRFETPTSSIRGYPNIFGDHFHPVLMLLAPLYWIRASASMLLVAQGVLLALSIVPVFVYVRDRVGETGAFLMAAAYALFWGLQQTAAFDVHEFAFAPLFVAGAILAMERRSWSWFWAAVVAVGLTKEDLLPLVAWFGVFLWWRGDRWRGAILAASGSVAFVVVTAIVIPRMAGTADFGYTGAYAEAMAQPWRIPLLLVSPTTKLFTALMWLAPFAFLPLASPLAALAVPLVFVRFLSASPLHWGTAFHYTAPLAPILAMAAGDGLAKVAARLATPLSRSRLVVTAAAASVVLAALLPGHQRHWRVFTPGFYRAAPAAAGAARALALVPPAASVTAQAAVLPHLSQRETAHVLRPGAPDDEYVVAARGLSPWPLSGDDEIRSLLDERIARGYRVLLQRDGWTVLVR
jgi:uncharacterized membrane protein